MPRKLSKNELKLQDGIPIVDYYNRFVVPAAKKFSKLSPGAKAGLCPFHDETDASFHIWAETKMFHCFGCGCSGDIIKMHQLFEWQYHKRGIDRKASMVELGNIFGIELDMTLEDENKDEEGLNPFQRAYKLVSDTTATIIPKNVFSLARFREVNDMLRSSNLSANAKVRNYCDIDREATVYLLNNKNS